jgi:hypothetical protein
MFVAPIQGLAMKKDDALLVLADPGRWPIRLRSGRAWAFLFQAFGLKDESPPPHVVT